MEARGVVAIGRCGAWDRSTGRICLKLAGKVVMINETQSINLYLVQRAPYIFIE